MLIITFMQYLNSMIFNPNYVYNRYYIQHLSYNNKKQAQSQLQRTYNPGEHVFSTMVFHFLWSF